MKIKTSLLDPFSKKGTVILSREEEKAIQDYINDHGRKILKCHHLKDRKMFSL